MKNKLKQPCWSRQTDTARYNQTETAKLKQPSLPHQTGDTNRSAAPHSGTHQQLTPMMHDAKHLPGMQISYLSVTPRHPWSVQATMLQQARLRAHDSLCCIAHTASWAILLSGLCAPVLDVHSLSTTSGNTTQARFAHSKAPACYSKAPACLRTRALRNPDKPAALRLAELACCWL